MMVASGEGTISNAGTASTNQTQNASNVGTASTNQNIIIINQTQDVASKYVDKTPVSQLTQNTSNAGTAGTNDNITIINQTQDVASKYVDNTLARPVERDTPARPVERVITARPVSFLFPNGSSAVISGNTRILQTSGGNIRTTEVFPYVPGVTTAQNIGLPENNPGPVNIYSLAHPDNIAAFTFRDGRFFVNGFDTTAAAGYVRGSMVHYQPYGRNLSRALRYIHGQHGINTAREFQGISDQDRAFIAQVQRAHYLSRHNTVTLRLKLNDI